MVYIDWKIQTTLKFYYWNASWGECIVMVTQVNMLMVGTIGAFQATRNSCFHDFILTTHDLLAFQASHESRQTNKQTCDWINMNIHFSTPHSYVCCFDYNVRNYVTLPFHVYVYFLTVGHRCLRSIRGSRCCLRWRRQKTNWEYIDHIRVHRSWVTSLTAVPDHFHGS